MTGTMAVRKNFKKMETVQPIKHAKLMGKAHEVPFHLPVGMGEVMTGTTIMATTYGEDMNGNPVGVVIGADSRTSTGTFVANRVTDKLTRITDNIYACRSGSAADTQAIVDIVQYHLRVVEIETGEIPRVETAAKLLTDIIYKYKDRLLASVIIAGWDPVKGGQVYAIPIGGTCVQQPWTIGGSGSIYIYGLCDELYRQDFDSAQAVDFVRTAIGHAVARDGSSGGVCRTAVLNKDGIDREVYNLNTKQMIAKQND